MVVDGPQSLFHDYTREWTMITNQGGLYEVNDCAFQLFAVIELALGEKLKAHLQRSIALFDSIATMLIEFNWSMQLV